MEEGDNEMQKKNRSKKRLIEAEDLCRIKLITSVALSPDERTVAYTMQTVSEDRKKYFSRIHMVDCETGESRRFTFGEVNDRGLVWSPDGRYLAFVSTRNMKTGIYVIPFDGGGARKIIEADGAFGNPVWTPDGKELVYMFRYNDSHTIEDEKKKREAPLYRHITRLAYRIDGAGFLPRARYQIWKVNVAVGNATQLTRGKRDNLLPVVSPNGKWVSFISRRGRNPDTENPPWLVAQSYTGLSRHVMILDGRSGAHTEQLLLNCLRYGMFYSDIGRRDEEGQPLTAEQIAANEKLAETYLPYIQRFRGKKWVFHPKALQLPKHTD